MNDLNFMAITLFRWGRDTEMPPAEAWSWRPDGHIETRLRRSATPPRSKQAAPPWDGGSDHIGNSRCRANVGQDLEPIPI